MEGEGKMLPALFSGKEIFGGGSEETFSFRRFPRSRDLYSPHLCYVGAEKQEHE